MFRRLDREPDQPVVPDEPPGLGDRRVAPADVDAVGVRLEDEVGAVVEDEERAVLVAGAAEGTGRLEELAVRKLLVAQLDDVDTAAQCGVEAGSPACLHDEVEQRALEPLAPAHRSASSSCPPAPSASTRALAKPASRARRSSSAGS